jgi:cytochrome c biogenesis protein CcmG/thiol:disulfide interchange protein DsbE
MPARSYAVLLTLMASLLASPAAAFEELATVDLAAYRGQVVYLDFWASWCAPCRTSFPFMDALQRENRARGLVVIAVNVDTERKLAADFLAETPVDFDIVFDPGGELAEEWHLEGMPTTVLIGRDGKPRSQRVGFRRADEDSLRGTVARLLAESPP